MFQWIKVMVQQGRRVMQAQIRLMLRTRLMLLQRRSHSAGDKADVAEKAHYVEKKEKEKEKEKIKQEDTKATAKTPKEGARNLTLQEVDEKKEKPSPRSEESDEWIESTGSKRGTGQALGTKSKLMLESKRNGSRVPTGSYLCSEVVPVTTDPEKGRDSEPDEDRARPDPATERENRKKETKEQSQQEEEFDEDFISVGQRKKEQS